MTEEISVIAGDYVFSDPIAFRHLAQEEATEIVQENVVIEGYQVYIVEQWACSRVHPVFVVTTFTGEESNKVTVSVLRILNADEYSDRLRHYFETLIEFHARPKDTPKGKIFVTNLSSFPSALNVVSVPDGCVDAHREEFIVNENLRRMGCTGRSALTLDPPSDATQDKFHQLYRTSDKIRFSSTVVDLVKLVQSCLNLFGELGSDMLDGLLCDVTERSLVEWWNIYGTPFYDVEPTDGILGPTTVAGILGMTLGVRYRLLSVRIEAPKDMMDVDHFKEAIVHFQKSVKIDRTRILDKQTLEKLYMLTVRSAVGEHRLPGTKTLRTTVHDLSNRTVVNAADIETCDIDEFIHHLHGERLKYMWQGKGRRPSTGSVNGLTPSQSFLDLKEGTVSKRQKMLRGVKTGAGAVGKMVRRVGPETMIERVQSNRAKRERETSDEMFVSSLEYGEPLTPVMTQNSTYSTDLRMTPPAPPKICRPQDNEGELLMIVSRIQSEEPYPETPRSSISEPREQKSSPQLVEPPQDEVEVPPPVIGASIERPKSASDEMLKEHHDAWYPRRLSFSIAQEAIEIWQCPFEIETDRLELDVDSINKWTEDQLDLVEESIDQTETALPTITSNYTSHQTTFTTLQSTVKALTHRITAFNDKTRGIYNTTMKLRYAYSSADGLKEKMASVETVMEGIVGRMEKLSRRLEVVEKLGVRHRLERRYRQRWLIMTGVCVFVGLAWALLHFR